MAIFEDIFKAEGAGPLALGVGAVLLAPAVLPAVGRIMRPVMKGVIKTGIAIYEETYASVKEATGDIIAEARAELESESHQTQRSTTDTMHKPHATA
jgi:hypothetical protein